MDDLSKRGKNQCHLCLLGKGALVKEQFCLEELNDLIGVDHLIKVKLWQNMHNQLAQI